MEPDVSNVEDWRWHSTHGSRGGLPGEDIVTEPDPRDGLAPGASSWRPGGQGLSLEAQLEAASLEQGQTSGLGEMHSTNEYNAAEGECAEQAHGGALSSTSRVDLER